MAIVKGGVWTNVEDEILKAAISKYGKNQWARISSLLVRKTPKQCKARWYEWLDPGIKKLEWTRDEDEKLLHLAKLLPQQWRTLATIVGRTATQCLERYQKLLDDAEAIENDELGLSGAGAEGAAPTGESIRKLRAGERDPDPESKPAKPDAIDMDEDEKEMLSEARARLANTQGKKAKRKQREKLLEGTKRLSVIQKRRDLKAAGINVRLHYRKKGEMDYNADIPFEHKPALGFYDTTEEATQNEHDRRAVNFRQVEQKRREGDAAQEDQRKGSKKRENDDAQPSASQAAALEKLRKAEQLTKRRKLNLPGPQVSDKELEDIVKLGQTSTEARELAAGQENAASSGLISEYASSGTAQPVRTPRTPAAQDSISLEARNLRAMTNTQSSLLGAENTPLHGGQQGTGYAGATPRNTLAATPNPLRRDGGETPVAHSSRALSTAMTPRRDNLSLNEDSASMQLTVQEEKSAQHSRAAQLRSQFASLPVPKNDFELEPPQDEVMDDAIDLSNDVIEDAAERDARVQRAREAEEARRAQQQSLAVQRRLPRPFVCGDAPASLAAIESGPERLIAEEMWRLLVSDFLKHPLLNYPTYGGYGFRIPDIDLELLHSIRATISAEAATHTASVSPEGHPAATELLAWTETEESEELDFYKRLLPDFQECLGRKAEWAGKLEFKASVLLGGYQQRSSTLSAKLRETVAALQQAEIDQMTFRALQANEEAAILTRTEVLRSEVARLEALHVNGQERYRLLQDRKEEFFAVPS